MATTAALALIWTEPGDAGYLVDTAQITSGTGITMEDVCGGGAIAQTPDFGTAPGPYFLAPRPARPVGPNSSLPKRASSYGYEHIPAL